MPKVRQVAPVRYNSRRRAIELLTRAVALLEAPRPSRPRLAALCLEAREFLALEADHARKQRVAVARSRARGGVDERAALLAAGLSPAELAAARPDLARAPGSTT